MAKKSSVTLVERKVNYSVKELEDLGIRIYQSNVNRLQDERLINTFKTHLLGGGRFETPGKLVNARECLKAGRVLYRSHKVSGKKTLKVAGVEDFTSAELDDFNQGRCLVVFDGNHRYSSMLRAIELAKSEKEKEEIKNNTFFNYENIPAGRLSEVFLEINTQFNQIDNQDYIPYILKNHGGKGGTGTLYEFDYALDACQRAKYTGNKDREGLFNYTGSLLICTGGIRPRAYSEKESLFLLAKKGKEGLELPHQCKSSELFKRYILVPYLFERNIVLNKMDHALIFKNNLRFLSRFLNTAKTPGEAVAFAAFLTESADAKNFLKEFRLYRTIRSTGGREIISSNLQRDAFFKEKWEEFKKNCDEKDQERIFAKIKEDFDKEVNLLKEKEEIYKKGNKGAYTANHNKMIASAKLSVVAMYCYLYERE